MTPATIRTIRTAGALISAMVIVLAFILAIPDLARAGGTCEPAAVTLDGSGTLVVDTGAEVLTAPAPGPIEVGPFEADTTVYYRVFGGGERDLDVPLWTIHPSVSENTNAEMKTIINEYIGANGDAWVTGGAASTPDFVTWHSLEVPGCTEEPTEEPTDPTEEPTASEEPTPSEDPTDPTEEPTPSEDPTDPTEEPTDPTDVYNCADFPLADGTTAQDVLDADPTDPHQLDGDDDGVACEADDETPADPTPEDPFTCADVADAAEAVDGDPVKLADLLGLDCDFEGNEGDGPSENGSAGGDDDQGDDEGTPTPTRIDAGLGGMAGGMSGAGAATTAGALALLLGGLLFLQRRGYFPRTTRLLRRLGR